MTLALVVTICYIQGFQLVLDAVFRFYPEMERKSCIVASQGQRG